MKKFSLMIANILYDKSLIEETKVDFFRFAIEVLITNICLLTSLVFVGYATSALRELFVFLLVFSPLRTYSEGYHANSFARCIGLTIFTFLFCVKLSDFTLYGNMKLMILFFVFALVLTCLYSNKENKNDNTIKFLFLLGLDFILLVIFYVFSDSFYIITSSALSIVLVLNMIWQYKLKI